MVADVAENMGAQIGGAVAMRTWGQLGKRLAKNPSSSLRQELQQLQIITSPNRAPATTPSGLDYNNYM